MSENDQYLLPDSPDGMSQYVSDLTIKRIPDATHWVTLEKPEVIISHIREFLAR